MMTEALFIKDEQSSPIKMKVEKIKSRSEYLEKYIGHLFCASPNCPANVIYAETPNLKVKKMFKTAKYNEHIATCPHVITYDANKKSTITSGEIAQSLSPKHKRDILKKLYQRNITPDTPQHETKPRLRKPSQPAPRDNKNLNTEPRLNPSIDPNAPSAKEGSREASVKKRKCTDVLNEDINKLLGMDGYISSAIVDDNYVDFEIDSDFSIRFYNAFRDSSPTAYSLIRELAHIINTTNSKILVCFIGILEKNNNGFQVQIMDSSLITFNNLSIFNYFLSKEQEVK